MDTAEFGAIGSRGQATKIKVSWMSEARQGSKKMVETC